MRHFLIANSCVVLLASACSPGRHFTGDGTFVTIGRWPLTNYEVHFEEVDVFKPGMYSYHFEGLPRMPAVLQIAIDTREGNNCETLKQSSSLREAAINLQLLRSGVVVAHMSGQLADWVWTYTLGGPWGRDWSTHDCAIYSDTLYFSGERSGPYELTLEVVVAADDAPPVRPVVASYAVYTP